MFDGVDAGTDRILDGGRCVGMHGHLEPQHVGRVDDGLHFVREELRPQSFVGAEAARCRELDDIGAQLVVEPDRFAALDGSVAGAVAQPGLGIPGLVDRLAVAMAAGDRQDGARHQDVRADDPPPVDRVADREHRLVIRADVAHGREPGPQRPPGVDHRVHGELGPGVRVAVAPFDPVTAECHLIPQVHMRVDQAGQDEAIGEIDDIDRASRGAGEPGGRQEPGHDPFDAVIVDHDRHVLLWWLARHRQQRARMYQHVVLCLGRPGGQRRQGNDRPKDDCQYPTRSAHHGEAPPDAIDPALLRSRSRYPSITAWTAATVAGQYRSLKPRANRPSRNSKCWVKTPSR